MSTESSSLDTTTSATNVTPKFTKHRVVYDKNISGIRIREFNDIQKCENTILVVGFPSVSITSVLVAGYFVDQLQLPLVGCFSSPEFPAKCVMDKYFPAYPIRIFGDNRVTVIQSEFKPTTNELTAHIVEAILDFALRHSIKNIFISEGLPTEGPKSKDEKVHFFSTVERINEQLTSSGHKPLIEGVLSGIAGLLLAESALMNPSCDVTCILSPTSSLYPDPQSAVEVVQVTDLLYPEIKIDSSPLRAKAMMIEKSVQKFVSSQTPEPHHSMYQ